ncbi:MAG: hypothetical protein CR982_05475 [Candidatus Cloacimonadota bacterium]|nr:MAG: hypothetical protein CR982_05475 [Candidatus Cloacimonadota bacterium]PIE77582.1 MAG: hypothetical protein CSA15_12150 [Candidatus Delongbacteria bacterium]
MSFNLFTNIAKKREAVAELEKQSQETMKELQNFFNENLQNYKNKVQAEIEQMHRLDTQKISDFNEMIEHYNNNIQELISERMKNFDKVLLNYNKQIEQLSQEIEILQSDKVNIIKQSQEEIHKLRNDTLAQTEARLKEEYENLHKQQDELARLQSEYKVMKQNFDLEQQKLQADQKRLEDYSEKLNQERLDIDKTVLEKIKTEKQNLLDYEKRVRDKEADIQNQVLKETKLERERLSDYEKTLNEKESIINEQVLAATDTERRRLSEYLKELVNKENAINQTVLTETDLERKRLEQYSKELIEKEANIKNTIDKETEFEKQRLSDLEEKLNSREEYLNDRETNLEEIIEEKTQERVENRKNEMEATLNRAKEDIKYFSEKTQGYEKLEQLYQEMYNTVGKDPASIMKQLAEKNETIRQLREELINRPTKEMEEEYRRLTDKKEKINEIHKRVKEKEGEYNFTFSENADLKTQIEPLKSQIDSLEKELARYRDIHQTEANRDERIKEIEKPLVNFSNKIIDNEEDVCEMDWLNDIDSGIRKFGLIFPKRILYAFHTALKCGEISPLTVLAGVSGTGKSELPRLYSHFGGLNFLSLPVQPNWDSQESMLGYFNSIDNRFDAQDILRLLVQTQKDDNLKEAITLILLDEMNLANVELYFSDFLSKLETRRGISDDKLPSIAVKLGSGLDDYQIPLGRNVLWTGTMNQDETTKTLSDKVLDRGIVINFPSPNNLRSRKITNTLPKDRSLLRRSVWNRWIKKSTPENISKSMDSYRNIIEGINSDIGKAGRAIGHRVWQSIESYINNYPTVISNLENEEDLKKAMDNAFADQLVQKIMPKLRGLEVEGIQGDCLKSVQSKISNYGLDEDFKNAMELGYGQFMWNTSNYALDSNNQDSEVNKTETSEQLTNEE